LSLTNAYLSLEEFDVSSVKGVVHDSRQVQPGFLFVALSGEEHDGRDYIDRAIENGASAILVEQGYQQNHDGCVVFVCDNNPRKALSFILSQFYQDQPEHIVAVTGTNGKSSVVHFLRQIWHALGCKAVSLGTLGVDGDTSLQIDGSMTTPDPVVMYRLLRDLKRDDVDYLAMEASSHGLDQCRLDGVRVGVAAFTSFSQDHLDYHKDQDAYFKAKARLFSDEIMQEGVAVLNADVPEYGFLAERAEQSGHRVWSYGYKGEDCKIRNVYPLIDGQYVEIEIFGRVYEIQLSLIGGFQAMNICCAVLCAVADGADVEKIIACLSDIEAVSGRMEGVRGSKEQPFAAYVDYAHTPQALEVALQALRPHVKGDILCIFGCGGDRDQVKRPLMGRAVYENADIVIITDDNPRSEAPEVIRAQIRAGIPEDAQNIHMIDGRKDAIEFAISKAKEGDAILLAGKGHENQQIFKNHVETFNDVEELQKAITRVGTF